MEISDLTLTQALAKSNSSSIHIELKSVLQKLESKTLEDFLNGEREEEMRRIDNEIRNIVKTNINHNHKSESEKVDLIAQIIVTVTEYLRNGISSGDVRSILIFLGVNCYLQIEIEKLLSEKEFEDVYTKLVSEKVIEILKSIKLETKPLPDAPYHEKEMMSESLDGFSENNIAKTYRFIEAIERGGRGFHFNFLLEHLISFLYYVNFPLFINTLSCLQNPTDFVFYFQSFKKEDLIKISNESSLSNKWLNFEIIRQIVEKENKENIDQLEVEALKNVLYRIGLNDFAFLKQTVTYFQRSRLFNASLGVFLASASNTQIEEIISDFVIDKFLSNIQARDALREYFVKFASDEQFDLIHILIFNKWKNYFENILTTDDFYQNNLLLTDFANFISNYHTHLTKDNDLLSEMESLIDNILFIDSQWTTSNSEQITKFHLYHSELFLFTFAYRNKRLNNSLILTKYEKLISHKIQLSRYVSDETKNYLEQGKRNIDWTKEYEV
ncbi:hypothetical protein ACK8HY_20160 [Sphingobacterium sp. NGMCC 1.201703]|uniref:hypothetical protein n=1 Tax=Sphingobacterium sp. NGMCC 1.201703 TaxID=3388657 RepID=UPI0039FDA2F3